MLADLIGSITVIIGIANFIFWVRSGFWAPKYIHWIAIASFVIGAGLAWMAHESGYPDADRHNWLIVLFPLLVYLGYAFFRGDSDKERSKMQRKKAG